jgi:hypothetical protein
MVSRNSFINCYKSSPMSIFTTQENFPFQDTMLDHNQVEPVYREMMVWKLRHLKSLSCFCKSGRLQKHQPGLFVNINTLATVSLPLSIVFFVYHTDWDQHSLNRELGIFSTLFWLHILYWCVWIVSLERPNKGCMTVCAYKWQVGLMYKVRQMFSMLIYLSVLG